MEITFSSVWCTFYVWWTAFYLRKWQILTHYPEVWEYNGHDFVLKFVIKYNRNYVCYVCEQHTLEHQLYLSWSKEESWMQTKVASWMYTRSCHLCSVCLKIRLALSVIWWWKPLLSMSGDQMNWLCLSDDENHCCACLEIRWIGSVCHLMMKTTAQMWWNVQAAKSGELCRESCFLQELTWTH